MSKQLSGAAAVCETAAAAAHFETSNPARASEIFKLRGSKTGSATALTQLPPAQPPRRLRSFRRMMPEPRWID